MPGACGRPRNYTKELECQFFYKERKHSDPGGHKILKAHKRKK
jgi:hypothetical protein